MQRQATDSARLISADPCCRTFLKSFGELYWFHCETGEITSEIRISSGPPGPFASNPAIVRGQLNLRIHTFIQSNMEIDQVRLDSFLCSGKVWIPDLRGIQSEQKLPLLDWAPPLDHLGPLPSSENPPSLLTF